MYLPFYTSSSALLIIANEYVQKTEELKVITIL